jgi:sugar lactone lactonase YvrE
MAFDANGNLWVADAGDRVLEFTPPFSSGMAAALVLGQVNFTAQARTSGAAALNFPTELTFDASGNLWIVDQGNNRLLEYKPPFTTGQSASVVLGQADFTSSSTGTTATGLSGPYGIAIDSSGSAWVSDYGNFRVLKFTPPFSSGQAASLVLGQPNFTTKAVSGNGQIDVPNPYGLAFDSSGNLFVAEVGWSRVVIFAPPFSTLMKASVVIGQPNFNSEVTTTTASGLAGVESVSTF